MGVGGGEGGWRREHKCMEQSDQREEGENACLAFKMTHAPLSQCLYQCIIKFRISGVNRNLVILGMLFQAQV